MKIFAAILVFLLLMPSAGCGSDLSRSMARKAIEKYFDDNPSVVALQLDDMAKVELEGEPDAPHQFSQKECWRHLADRGLVTMPVLDPRTETVQSGPLKSSKITRYFFYSVEVKKPDYVLRTARGGSPIFMANRKIFSPRVAYIRAFDLGVVSIDEIGEPTKALMGQVVSPVTFTYEEKGTGFHEVHCGHSPLPSPSSERRAAKAVLVLHDSVWRVDRVEVSSPE
jgi:hypothetical protein